MISPEEAIRRLGDVSREIDELRKAIEEGWEQSQSAEPTLAFLEKCGGWEDSRSAEEIIAEIYAGRSVSSRGSEIFGARQS